MKEPDKECDVCGDINPEAGRHVNDHGYTCSDECAQKFYDADAECDTCMQAIDHVGICEWCGGDAVPLCNDCRRPIDYDGGLEVYVHLVEPERPCFLIAVSRKSIIIRDAQ